MAHVVAHILMHLIQWLIKTEMVLLAQHFFFSRRTFTIVTIKLFNKTNRKCNRWLNYCKHSSLQSHTISAVQSDGKRKWVICLSDNQTLYLPFSPFLSPSQISPSQTTGGEIKVYWYIIHPPEAKTPICPNEEAKIRTTSHDNYAWWALIVPLESRQARGWG